MSEDELLREVVGECTRLGLRVFHSTDSRRDIGRGWPDLVIGSPAGRVVFAELKSSGGQLSSDQAAWKWIIRAAGLAWHQWGPADWQDGTIERALAELA